MRRRQFFQGGLALCSLGLSKALYPAEFQIAPSSIHPSALQELIIRHFCFGKVYVRRDAHALIAQDPNHPVIKAYSDGVKAMKGRQASDPTSWDYQANIHGTTLQQMNWPAGAPFGTCEHHTSFFLSWHRMFLYFFERIVRAASGYPDFALPYWNYSKSGQAGLPAPFRQGGPAPLFDGTRSGNLNTNGSLPASVVSTSNALSKTTFLGSGNFQGRLESTPHDDVHITISGNMGSFPGAGRDPIFWLHHCNIDRLWEAWLGQGGGRSNPVNNAAWMNQSYKFVDENKTFVTLTGADILYTASQLRYQYDNPYQCIPITLFQQAPRFYIVDPRLLKSFLILEKLRIRSGDERVELRVADEAMRERVAEALRLENLSAEVQKGVRYRLRFEGIRTQAPLGGVFEVYIGLPKDVEPHYELPYYAGNLAPFGADAQSRRSMAEIHPEHARGLTRELDITEALINAAGREAFRRTGFTVTLVPTGVAQEGQSFRIDPDANPEIDAIVLNAFAAEDL